MGKPLQNNIQAEALPQDARARQGVSQSIIEPQGTCACDLRDPQTVITP